MFDARLLEDVQNPYRRAILIEAMGIKTEENFFMEWLARILDTLFVTLIKFQPAFSKEQASAIGRLKNILRFPKKKNEEPTLLSVGDVTYRVVGEIDDSELY